MKKWLLNSMVPPQNGGFVYISPPFAFNQCEKEMKAFAAEASAGGSAFIGHPATAELLRVPPNRGEANPQPGDVAAVVRLKKRAVSPGDVEVSKDDLEVRWLAYMEAVEPPWQKE